VLNDAAEARAAVEGPMCRVDTASLTNAEVALLEAIIAARIVQNVVVVVVVVVIGVFNTFVLRLR